MKHHLFGKHHGHKKMHAIHGILIIAMIIGFAVHMMKYMHLGHDQEHENEHDHEHEHEETV